MAAQSKVGRLYQRKNSCKTVPDVFPLVIYKIKPHACQWQLSLMDFFRPFQMYFVALLLYKREQLEKTDKSQTETWQTFLISSSPPKPLAIYEMINLLS